MVKLSILLGSLFASQGLAVINNLNLTAITAINGASTFECWQMGPFADSTKPGMTGGRSISLGDMTNATFFVVPPKFNGGLHHAPAVQFVYFVSGSAQISLPNSSDTFSVRGGRNGLFVVADTADVSAMGHRTIYQSKVNTVGVELPINDVKALKHQVLHSGPCLKNEQKGYN